MPFSVLKETLSRKFMDLVGRGKTKGFRLRSWGQVPVPSFDWMELKKYWLGDFGYIRSWASVSLSVKWGLLIPRAVIISRYDNMWYSMTQGWLWIKEKELREWAFIAAEELNWSQLRGSRKSWWLCSSSAPVFFLRAFLSWTICESKNIFSRRYSFGGKIMPARHLDSEPTLAPERAALGGRPPDPHVLSKWIVPGSSSCVLGPLRLDCGYRGVSPEAVVRTLAFWLPKSLFVAQISLMYLP